MAKRDTDPIAFIKSAGAFWLTFVGGSGITAALLVIFERLTGQAVPLKIYVGVVVFFALSACYRAWKGEVVAVNKYAQAVDKCLPLNELIGEGYELLAKCGRGQPNPPLERVDRWLLHADECLGQLGETYLTRLHEKVVRPLPPSSQTILTGNSEQQKRYVILQDRLWVLQEIQRELISSINPSEFD